MMSIGEKIQQERVQKKISLEAFAELANISHSYMILIETGKKMPSAKMIFNIAKALEIRPSIVLNWYLEDLQKKLSNKNLEQQG